MIPADQDSANLHEFLLDAGEGLLGARAVVEEAELWLGHIARTWPHDRPDAGALVETLEALAGLPVGDEPPLPEPPPFEPLNPLEQAVLAANADPWQRSGLWQALHAGPIVLPVLAYELRPEEGLTVRFLTMPLDAFPVVVGFTAEERFDALLSTPPDFPRLVLTGSDLPPIWPPGHALQLNPGYDASLVLTPDEITHLPDGPPALRYNS